MAYQTVGDVKGGSDSEAKLAALQIPSVEGKAFLDIGCNAGFFCEWALSQGASRAVGIDKNEGLIEFAKQRKSAVEYIHGDWFTVLENLEERFDVILHSSSFHYVSDKERFIDLVQRRLAPDGIFVLEVGIVSGEVSRYHFVKRKGYTRHLTRPLLAKLLDGFALRNKGRSVMQKGDPIPRYVFHCQPERPSVILIGGPSYSGKSQLAAAMAGGEDVTSLKMDGIIRSLVACPDSAVEAFFQEHFAQKKGLAEVSPDLIREGLVPRFCEMVAQTLPRCYKVLVLEGEVLSDARIRRQLANTLIDHGFRAWEAGRLYHQPVGIESAGDVFDLFSAGSFAVRSHSDKLIKVRPLDGVVTIRPPKATASVKSTVCWTVPNSPANRFECFIRANEKGNPVRMQIDVVSGEADVNAVLDGAGTVEEQYERVLEGSTRYERVCLKVPAGEAVAIRVTAEMAKPEERTHAAAGFVVSPRFVLVDDPQRGENAAVERRLPTPVA